MWMPDRCVDLMEKKDDGWTGADIKLRVRRGIYSHQQMTFLVFCASSDKWRLSTKGALQEVQALCMINTPGDLR